MAYRDLTTAETDAKSPGSDDVFTAIKDNFEDHDAMLKDGASAPATLDTNKVAVRSTAADAFDVAGSGQIDGNLNVDGQFSTGSFFRSDDTLWFELEVW